jgi:hypothetical protein
MKLKPTNKATMLLRARRRRALNFGAFAVGVWREPSPLLGQGGVAAPLIKCREASLAGADGVVRSSYRF